MDEFLPLIERFVASQERVAQELAALRAAVTGVGEQLAEAFDAGVSDEASQAVAQLVILAGNLAQQLQQDPTWQTQERQTFLQAINTAIDPVFAEFEDEIRSLGQGLQEDQAHG